jgi:hypothetical protein
MFYLFKPNSYGFSYKKKKKYNLEQTDLVE